MSDRLNELRRQRALAQEQLAWFDHEIAREEGVDASAAAPLAQAAGPSASTTQEPTVNDQQADRIIEQYRHQGRSIQGEVRRGCFLYFGAAFALLAAALVLFYLFRPHS